MRRWRRVSSSTLMWSRATGAHLGRFVRARAGLPVQTSGLVRVAGWKGMGQ